MQLSHISLVNKLYLYLVHFRVAQNGLVSRGLWANLICQKNNVTLNVHLQKDEFQYADGNSIIMIDEDHHNFC